MEATWNISKVSRFFSKKKNKKTYEAFWIHLPIDLVRAKNIKAGDKFLFKTNGNQIVLEKVI